MRINTSQENSVINSKTEAEGESHDYAIQQQIQHNNKHARK